MRPAGGDADEHVADADVGTGEQLVALGDADERSGDVEGTRRVHARHLGGLATEQGAAGHSARFGHPADHLGHEIGIEHAGGDVVEEEQRPRRLDEHVVDAVVDDVHPDAAHHAETRREFDLRADAVGRRDEHGVAQRRDGRGAEHATEAADATQHAVVVGGLDRGLHLGDRPRALVDVDARFGVRSERGAERPPSDVAADLHAVETDGHQPVVRVSSGRGEVVAQPGHGEHAAAGDGSRRRRRPHRSGSPSAESVPLSVIPAPLVGASG